MSRGPLVVEYASFVVVMVQFRAEWTDSTASTHEYLCRE
jgi:hypothetical protein